MVSRQIKSARCDDALTVLTRFGDCVFFTLTTPDEVDYHEIAARWRAFSNDLFRWLRRLYRRKPLYVMNFEAHPGYLQKVVPHRHLREVVLHGSGRSHGWHIHGVVDCYCPVHTFRRMAEKFGFGRVNLKPVTSLGVAAYLTKHALKAYRGLSRKQRQIYSGCRLRLVNTSRGLPALSEYSYKSDVVDATRKLSFEQRESDVTLRATGLGSHLKRPDYRKIRVIAEIAAVCNFAHIWDFWRMVERLQFLRGVAHQKK